MIYAQYNITYRHSIDVVWKQLKTYSSKSWKLTDFPLTRICPQNTILFFLEQYCSTVFWDLKSQPLHLLPSTLMRATQRKLILANNMKTTNKNIIKTDSLKKGLTGRITKKQNTKPGLSCFFFVVWFSSFFFFRFALVLCFFCNTLHSLCCWTHKSTYFRSGCHTSRLEDPSRAFIRHCLWECFIFIRWFIIPMNYIYTHNI